MNKANPDAALKAMLKDQPILRLTLRDRDYGAPCPVDRWQVKSAIDHLLMPSHMGMVLYVDVLEDDDGVCDDVLVIGVVNPEAALPKLRDLLKNLNVPAGATLVFEGSDENQVPELPTRDQLVRQTTDGMIQMVLMECIKCAPKDWQAGTLTIQCDGSWLGYKLKNGQSRNAATISASLSALCEELAVFMWKNGQQWREAILQYEGKSFNVGFTYEEPLDPIPRVTLPPTPKPWWKRW